MLLAICKTHAPYCVHTTHCHILFGSFCLALMAPGRVRKFPNDFADCVSGHVLPAADHMVRAYYWAMLPHETAYVYMCMCWWQAEHMVFVSCVGVCVLVAGAHTHTHTHTSASTCTGISTRTHVPPTPPQTPPRACTCNRFLGVR